jgi:glutamate decarboxylase
MLNDGNARQNLATFCQTYMEPEAERLMSEFFSINAIDKSEYPQMTELETRCVRILGRLWGKKDSGVAGISTVGSSEACMLGGLAMKFRWEEQAEKAGIDTHAKKPNLVISSAYQICWEKFCVYWDIELRTVPINVKHMTLNMDTVMDYVDEYTIGIVGILGVTYTGRFDDIEKLNDLVEHYNKKAKIKTCIHIDAASGGMIVPFTDPNLKWDFRLKNVQSINTSGHKYGLVYPGVGWILWKDKTYLPRKLTFEVSYLGGTESTIALNFSRSGSQIIGQYYIFLRYGMEGLQTIHNHTLKVAQYLAKEIDSYGIFDIYNDASEIPIICYKLKSPERQHWTLYELADRMAMRGWQIPAYTLPADMEDVLVQRMVIRADFSAALADTLLRDFRGAIDYLKRNTHHAMPGKSKSGAQGFTH